MPNWCENTVTVVAETKENAEVFVNFVRNGENCFSFDRIIPMPEELRGTKAPATIVTQEEYDNFKPSKDEELFGIGKPITQEMSDKFRREYGFDNWYDWAIRNWGVKWDSNCEEVNTDDSGEVRFTFDTPWGPPTEIYHRLTEIFPKLDISWHYHEPGMEMTGYLNNH
jgi:hypothetical protein